MLPRIEGVTLFHFQNEVIGLTLVGELYVGLYKDMSLQCAQPYLELIYKENKTILSSDVVDLFAVAM